MKISRKFNLNRIHPDLKYETVTIEAEGEQPSQIIQHINEAWKEYRTLIRNGKVE